MIKLFYWQRDPALIDLRLRHLFLKKHRRNNIEFYTIKLRKMPSFIKISTADKSMADKSEGKGRETNGNGRMLFMQSLDRLILKKGSTNNTPLVRNLLSKKKLLLKGNPSHARIKTALIIGGGGMRSAFSAGALRGLEKSGLADVFDIVVGISAGSPICAYFLSGQTALGTSIYFEELAKNKFINFAR